MAAYTGERGCVRSVECYFVIWCVSHPSAVVCEGLPHDLMLAKFANGRYPFANCWHGCVHWRERLSSVYSDSVVFSNFWCVSHASAIVCDGLKHALLHGSEWEEPVCKLLTWLCVHWREGLGNVCGVFCDLVSCESRQHPGVCEGLNTA